MENLEQVLNAIGKSTNFEELIGHYVSQRDEKEIIKREYAEKTAPIDALLGRIETRLQELMQASGQENAKTKFGTAYEKTGSAARIADWNVFIDYVKKHDAYDLLVKNVSKEAVKSRIDESGEIVPGVDITTFKTIGVRRA